MRPQSPRYHQRILLLLALFVAALGGVACDEDPSIVLVDGRDNNQRGDLVVDESAIVAVRDGADLTVQIGLQSRLGLDAGGEVEVALRDLDGNLIDSVKNSFTLTEGAGVATLELTGLPADAETGDLAKYVLHYRVRSFRAELWGRRSVFAAVKKREINLLSPDTFYAASDAGMRIIAREPVTGEPLANAEVEAFLDHPDPADDTKTVREPLFTGRTDEFGVVAAHFAAPAEVMSGDLVLVVKNELGSEVISRPIQVVREEKILLTTDKPLYQPGQTIHLRALALARPSLTPAANQPVLFEVRDGKGNKLFKVESVTNAFGIASADFRLAHELNMGEFKIQAFVGQAEAEKTVTVERYVLPKFKVDFNAAKTWYRPGEQLSATVAANYLFGKPVAGGHIAITASTFDVGFNQFANLSGQLDEAGNYAFTLDLPTYFVGGTLEAGQAFVQLDIEVTDDADHTQSASRQLTIAAGSLVLNAIPRNNLVAGQPGTLYVLATDPTGMPLQADLTLTGDDIAATTTTNESGIGVLSFAAPATEQVELTVAGTDASGNKASQTLTLEVGTSSDDGAIGLVTDKALYEVGNVAELAIFTHTDVRRVFVDVIRAGQTVLTTTLDVDGGLATYTYAIEADVSGSVHFEVYYASNAGRIIRARKLVFIEAANDLQINATLDAAEYRPGETATIDLAVTDAKGQAVQAALGISIVDEAVYALQEMQPGLEKIFFRIEEELLKPRYEIHGFSAADLVVGPATSPEVEAARNQAAAVLMASVEDVSPYPITVNTLAEARLRSVEVTKGVIETDTKRILERLGQILDLGIFTESDAPLLVASVDGEFADPWGQDYRVASVDAYTVTITSGGPDETFDNEDDVTITAYTWNMRSAKNQDVRGDGGECWDCGPMAGGAWDDADGFNGAPGMDPTAEGSSNSGSEPPRVRKYFPETLYFNPSLITDDAGNATLTLPMADSITTWRMTSMASSQVGQLGSGTTPILVFQPFFIDIDFPVTLTQHDEISVPVALYNYLGDAQTVALQVDQSVGSWFTLLDTADKSVDLQPNEVSVVHFRVRVEEVGYHPFRVFAYGSSMSDAIERRIEVVPDGKEFPISISGRLDADVAETVDIPGDAVAGGSTLFVKIYPGMFSQVVEGLDSLFQMPSGCFEQTSSTTYPNVLALAYMQETGQVTPEIELKAQEYISLGYQRLLSFESNGGGFEWFGGTPAHRILTSYGLLEFTDMNKVHPVDEAMIARTQNWLASQQESDGRFKAAPEGIHEGATNNFQDSDLRATAYITYALLYSGYDGAGMTKAVSWLKQNASTGNDAYTLAVVANALLLHDASDPTAGDVVRRLADMAKTKPGRSGDLVYWESESQSLYYSSGDTMNMETTAMALLALIEAGTYPNLVEGGVNFLIENKDAFGNWSSTQATILSLRAFIAMLGKATENVDATVRVYAGGTLVQELTVNAFNSDVLQQVDLKAYTVTGPNHIQIELDGTGSLLYQIAGRYYLPWSESTIEPGQAMSIDVAYDRTQLAVNDRVTATATVTNNTDGRLDMILVDLGIPPGFNPILDALYADVAAGRISKVETTDRQIIVYLYGLDPHESLSFSYQLEARMPLEASTPSSTVYLYYDPAESAEAAPVEIIVL